MSDREPTTRTWNSAKTLLEDCPKRLPENVTAAAACLVSEAVLHAADRIVQAINRRTQVAAGAADKALGD